MQLQLHELIQELARREAAVFTILRRVCCHPFNVEGMAADRPAAHSPSCILRLGRAVRSACFPAAVTLSQP